ncbi:SRPBCC family protein [Cumulibacter soli]|uniref:SRPBCC family protein n=1 Tax=Cumulibacter soli TaxID=2546344 RepID=UPI0010680706|nr:SRPBCC family protein [Cumulibacter soli]
MPVTAVHKDTTALTMTIVADFPVSQRRLWDAYADPRQIEKFWGPVTYPAKFLRHDMQVGGRSHYVMTGPEGDTSPGYWEFLNVDEPRRIEVRDGFAADDGTPKTDTPDMRMVFDFEGTDKGSRVTMTTHFNSLEELEQLIGMGMEEGTLSAMSQIDTVVTDLQAFAADRLTEAQILNDTQIRVSRVIRGTVQQVWDAHHDPEIMKRWLLGPDGWVMPVAEVAAKVGDIYRQEWEREDGTDRFGFTGELLESQPPYREVTTEQMIDTDYPPAQNEMTLTPVDGGTLLAIVITYPSADVRDAVLATGMTDGMETSYARLERMVLTAVQ